LDQLYPEIALSPVTLGNRWTFVAVEEFQSSPSYEGNPMRPLVEPPPSSSCMCGGELKLKLIEAAERQGRGV
jgi:hypothetical protein